MFYERYEALCQKSGKKPYTVAREVGCGPSNVAQWKKGSTPRPNVLQRIAEYFNVSQAYLLGLEEEKEKPAPTNGNGLSDDLIVEKARLIEKIQHMGQEELDALNRLADVILGRQ